MKALALKDFLDYRFLSSVKFAPGGQRAAFVVSTCNEEENRYESRLWLWENGLRQLTDLGGESSFIWEDDTHILFPAVRTAAERKRKEKKDAFTSYYRLDINGGEAIHAFTLPFAAGRLEKTDCGYVALGSIDVAYPDYYKMTAEERAAVAKHYEDEKDYEVLDEVPFWRNGLGMINKRRTALFTVSPDGQARRITDPLFQTVDLLCLDGAVFYTGFPVTTKRYQKCEKLYRLDPASGETGLLGEYPDLDISKMQQVGQEIWIAGRTGQAYGLKENHWIYSISPVNGQLTLLRREEYSCVATVGSDCRYGSGTDWQTKSGKLYHLTTREGSSHLYCVDRAGSSTPVITKKGSIDIIAISERNDTALLVAQYDKRLQELYAADLSTGEVYQLSHFNDLILSDKYVADYHPLTVESQGYSIGGWVMLPKDFDPDKTYPAVLDIHGGPKTAYGPVFYHEMQLWANMGYFVFFCNPQGSDGRDNEFMDMRGKYGETDYCNLMDFTDAVLDAYPQIDRNRVCVTGGSYGGFMTNWIIGHTDRFCCAASQRSISNWISFYGVAGIGTYFATDQCDADPFNSPEKLWRQSPLRYAANAKTPTLFIHADEDYTCPLAEGLQMYTALVDLGVPTRLCMFHGENHELSRSGKPRHRVRRLEEITNWFEQYAK